MTNSPNQPPTSSPQESAPPDADEPLRVNEAGVDVDVEDEVRYELDPTWTGRL